MPSLYIFLGLSGTPRTARSSDILLPSSCFLSSAVSRLLSGRLWTMKFFSRSSRFISCFLLKHHAFHGNGYDTWVFVRIVFFSVFSLPLQSTCHRFCHPLMRIPPPAPESCISLLDLIIFPVLFQDTMPLSYPPPQWLSECIPLVLLVPPQWLLSHIFPWISAHGCWGCLQFFAQFLIRMPLAVLLVSHWLWSCHFTPCQHWFDKVCACIASPENVISGKGIYSISPKLCAFRARPFIARTAFYQVGFVFVSLYGCGLCNSTFPYFRPWRPWLPSCHHWNAVIFHDFLTQG